MNMRIALILMSYLCAAQQQIPLAALANTRALIKFNAETKIFRLSTVRSSWAFRIHPETGQLQHLYWGSLISNDDDLTYLDAENEIVSFDAGVKNGILQEFPDDGSGDYRLPAFRLRYEDDGYSLANFVYSSHKIDQLGGKVYAEWQPHVRTVVDVLKNVRVQLTYTVIANMDTITRAVRFINDGSKTVVLEEVNSCSVDFPAAPHDSPYQLTHLVGSWGRERQLQTRYIALGLQGFESRRGASSHQHNPFIVLSKGHPQEDSGEVFGVGLVWPSSHRTLVERTQSGTVRLVMGVHPDSFRWNLRPGEQFLAPEAVHVYSSTGVGGMSRQMHSLIRHRVLPAAGTTKWTFDAPRPVLVNSWEAMYFNCSEQAILESLVEPAADLGCIDLIVLDDGWFKNRVDDRRALGDWVTDSGKFPSGLQSLALRIQQRGMQFGIWMEPEMISVDSDLYRFHPDWCLQVPGRRKTESRNQLVLDLSRLDVQQFIVESVSRVLRESSASYLKWDFNRHLSEVGSMMASPHEQGEVLYRWVMGLWRVLYLIRTAFPDVLLESCSGGGGRFDLSFHYFSHQIWTSDNTDSLSRTKIQFGTLFAYPPNSMASHISAIPNHQTHRKSSFWSRHVVAMSGLLGYELNLKQLSGNDRATIRAIVPYYKKFIEPLVLGGDLFRLNSPFSSTREEGDSSPTVAAWSFVSADKRYAVVFCMLTSFYEVVIRPPRITLKGLSPTTRYQIEQLSEKQPTNTSDVGFEILQFGGGGKTLYGQTLLSAGLPVHFNRDADGIVFRLEAVEM